MDLLDQGFGALGDFTRAQMPEGILTDLIVDGIIAGVGGVLIFLPQILLSFFVYFDSRRHGLYVAGGISFGQIDVACRTSRQSVSAA